MKWIAIVILLLTDVNGLSDVAEEFPNPLSYKIYCPEVDMWFSDAPPYTGLPAPSCPNRLFIVMKLFTRRNPTIGQTITANSIPSYFKGSVKTIYVVHGLLENGIINPWLYNLKDAALKQGDYNVIIVDWKVASMNVFYPQAASNTRTVGACVAFVSNYTINRGGSSRSRQYCVGVSLGAHVCGHAGMNGQFGRITGLDPAGPLFEDRDKSTGLNPSSADFVDIVHTNGGSLLEGSLGAFRPLGHVDFYANGGKSQPGCASESPDFPAFDINSPTETIIGLLPICSHARSVSYFIESIELPCFFTKSTCTEYKDLPNSCKETENPVQSMGFYADEYSQRGIFYVKTNNKTPFCIN